MQPISVESARYLGDMTPEEVKAVLVENIRTLLGLADDASGVQRLINLGIATGNAQRALDDHSQIRLALVAEVATKLGVEPWQLIAPNLGADLDRLDKQEVLLIGYARGAGGAAELLKQLQQGEFKAPAPAPTPEASRRKSR